MTQQEILQYNRMCAEFLGVILHESQLTMPHSHFTGYHSDWNLIMEVVEAIEKLDDKFYFVKINTGGCFIHPLNDTKDYKGICYQAGKTKKEAVVQAINQFLIWYNNNK